MKKGMERPGGGAAKPAATLPASTAVAPVLAEEAALLSDLRSLVQSARQRLASVAKDIDVITNGYDEADFNADKKQLSPKFTITHISSMNAERNPHVFWKALKNIIETNPNFESLLEIKLIGPLDHAITVSIEQYGLLKYVNKTDFVPHSEAIKNLCNSQVLLLPINNTPNAGGVLPGKLYEYLGAQRPIICITEGNPDSARIMHESGAASLCGYNDVPLMEKIILDLFAAFQAGNNTVPKNNIEKFSRKNLSGSFVIC